MQRTTMLESENTKQFRCNCIHLPQLLFLGNPLLEVSTFFLEVTSCSMCNVTVQYRKRVMI